MGQLNESKLHLIADGGPSPRAAVVFVHGLGGDAFNTWKTGTAKNDTWPYWLGQDLPDVRVYSFGYDASPSVWLGRAMPLVDRATNALSLFALEDSLRRLPTIFVCHSLGGLLVKEVLHQADTLNNQPWKELIAHTKGVVFLATPHAGTSVANYVTGLGTLFGLRPGVNVNELRANDSALRGLNVWYARNVGRLGINNLVFYETYNTHGVRIVDETTATGGLLQSVIPLPIDADHLAICKPTSRDAQTYRLVKSFVEPFTHVVGDGNLSHMPDPVDSHIKQIGRDKEYENLQTIYQNKQTGVACIHGFVGSGKTFLLYTLVNNIKSNKNDETRLFWWPFDTLPGKDSKPSPLISSTDFFANALPVFGHDGELPDTEDTRLQCLVRLLRKHKSLLVLDGVENLQQPDGTITDHLLNKLLHDMAERVPDIGSIVLVGSEYPLKHLQQFNGYREIKLEPLQDAYAVELLQKKGVCGSSNDLRELVTQLGCNPLTILLVASQLTQRFGCEVNQWPSELQPSEWQWIFRATKEGEHAWKAIEWYDRQLTDNQRTFLQLLGLVGRKMEKEDLEILFRSRAGSSLAQLLPAARRELYSTLSDCDLLSGNKHAHQFEWDSWDTHTLMRQYFSEQLFESDPEKWRDAHRVMFDGKQEEVFDSARGELFFKSPSLEELTTMFDVLRHGYLGGRYVDAYKFYRYGIAQDWRGFDTEVRGAVSDALNAVSSFFRNESYDQLIEELAGKLDAFDKAWLLSRASYCLESLGKLRDALAPRTKSNDIYMALYSNAEKKSYGAFERARDTAFGLEELAGIQMRLGHLGRAEDTAREAVRWANVTAECETKSRDAHTWKEPSTKPDYIQNVRSWLRQCSTRSMLGAVLHRLGKLDEAFNTLEEARTIKKENEPQWGLHSEPGVRYCMLKLDRAKTPAEREEVLSHANEMLRWSDESDSQSATEIIKGLHYLIKGRALAELGHINEAQDTLNDAVTLIRHSNKRQFLYETLLARAAVQRLNMNINGAEKDVNEVLEGSRDYNMRLYQADAYLLDGHIALDLTNVERAKKDLEVGNDLINRMSYRLRVAELHLLAARIEHLINPSNRVVHEHLDKAHKSLEDINYGRLLRQWTNYEMCFQQTGEVCLRWGAALPEQIRHL